MGLSEFDGVAKAKLIFKFEEAHIFKIKIEVGTKKKRTNKNKKIMMNQQQISPL